MPYGWTSTVTTNLLPIPLIITYLQRTKIYDINPMYAYDMDPETDEKSRAIIDTQLRNSGYRLAAKLNEYFDY